MINRNEALSIQQKRSKRCIIISVVSIIILASAAVLLSIFVANSPGVSFFAVFAVIIEFYILRKIHFSQFFEPKELFVKVIKNEAVTVTQKSFSGASGAGATYNQVQLNQIQMTLANDKGIEIIKRYPYKSDLGTIRAGDELVVMRFIYEPVVV